MDLDQTRRITTIRAAVMAAESRLAAARFPTPRLDAEVLLRHLVGFDRTGYFLHQTDPISAPDLESYERLIDRRLTREPVAYIIGRREFMALTFSVGPGVLVPRPETEILVEWALELLAAKKGPRTVLDVGTGSGAIALSIAALGPPEIGGPVVAADVSGDALRYAARNRTAMGLDHNVSLVRGDLGEWCGGGIDIVLANLPYLRPEQIDDNPDLAPEPVRALDGGADGLDLVRRLLFDAPRLLTPDGAIGLEIDPSQADAAVALGRVVMPGLRWAVIPDLAGHLRHVVGA